MKKTTKKLLALLGVATLLVGSLTACGNTEEPSSTTSTEVTTPETTPDTTTETAETDTMTEETPTLEGTILMAGSTSMEKLASVVAEAFMEKYPNVTVNAEFTGSSAGVESLLAGSVNIGNSSRNLKDSEKEAGAVENIVAIDGIAVVVDPANTVNDLTKQQLFDIYTGVIKNWSEVGGSDAPIIVVGREAGSGTRGAFEELVEVEDVCEYSNELDSTGAVMAKVASTPGAIGYVSLDIVDETVTAVALDSVAPTVDNIKGGTYFLSRPFVIEKIF